MRIAVLGAGLLGVGTAFELSKEGCHIDLYDRGDEPLTQAASRNEGKLHLGHVYGADTSFRTANKMLDGSLSFYSIVRGWIGEDLDSISFSTPFVYLLDQESQLDRQVILNHFRKIDQEIAKRALQQDVVYPGGSLCRTEEISLSESSFNFDRSHISAAFITPERAIVVQELAEKLKLNLFKKSDIRFISNAEIISADVIDEKVAVTFVKDDVVQKSIYDVVINALWDGRVAIDAQIGLPQVAPWCFRLKHAIFAEIPLPQEIPSATIIQGAFGDVVNFGNQKYYLSWYPSCMQGFSTEIYPPLWEKQPNQKGSLTIFRSALQGLSTYFPSLSSMINEDKIKYDVKGGIIFGSGNTDIIDPKSGLHNRYTIGIQSKGNYYSIDPGKYCLCPYYAQMLAQKLRSKFLCLVQA